MKQLQLKRTLLDILVPFGRFLRENEHSTPFKNWNRLLFQYIPQAFFIYWLFSLIPNIGNFLYITVLIPLSAWQHIQIKKTTKKVDRIKIFLWYFVVIIIGFVGIWNFIGHTILADTVAKGIGWPTGSPFQIELAFYTLGTAVAALMTVWIRGHMISALVISKSIFWYGAAFVHIQDMIINNNYEPLNIGPILIGDILFPTVLLLLLREVWKDELKKT